jgi:hypothetical protein
LGLPVELNSQAEGAAGLYDAVEWAWKAGEKELWPLLRNMLERELLKYALSELRVYPETFVEFFRFTLRSGN